MSAASTKTRAPWTPGVRAAAIEEFGRRHAGRPLAPVVVVIAAEDEEESVGGVVGNVPATAFSVSPPAAVRREQVQHQTSELLIGAIARGYWIVERPAVIHKHTAGKSTKGGNVLDGFRCEQVVLAAARPERRCLVARRRGRRSP